MVRKILFSISCLFLFTLINWAGAARAQTCGKLCDPDWMKQASPAQVAALLKAGARVNARDDQGRMPLHYAAKWKQNPEVITILLKAGAKVNARDDQGRTPLQWAAFGNENPEVITILLKAGAKVNARDDRGRTPLQRAAFGNENPEVITVLLNAGAKKNTRDDQGRTPLERAKKNRNYKVFTTLQRGKTVVDARDKRDVSPSHTAAASDSRQPDQNPLLVYVGLGFHQNTFDLGSGYTVSAGSDRGERLFEESVSTTPLILGVMIEVVEGEISVAYEFQFHSGTGRKEISTNRGRQVETVAEYDLTLFAVQPHFAFGEDKSAFLMIGRASLKLTLSEANRKTGSFSGETLYFGGGFRLKTSENWSWRLALRKMSFPVEGIRDEIKNTNIGVSGLYTF